MELARVVCDCLYESSQLGPAILGTRAVLAVGLRAADSVCGRQGVGDTKPARYGARRREGRISIGATAEASLGSLGGASAERVQGGAVGCRRSVNRDFVSTERIPSTAKHAFSAEVHDDSAGTIDSDDAATTAQLRKDRVE